MSDAAAMPPLRRATPADAERLTALQQAAYAPNRDILGVEPLPLQVDYRDMIATMETWLAEDGDTLTGALILQPHPGHLLIWSIATDPALQSRGLGNRLLAAAEARARDLGLSTIRLYTGTSLTERIAWYARRGFSTERIEQRPDRSVTHMIKTIALPPAQ